MLSTGSFPKPGTGRLDKDERKLRKIIEVMFSQVSLSSRVAKRTAPLIGGWGTSLRGWFSCRNAAFFPPSPQISSRASIAALAFPDWLGALIAACRRQPIRQEISGSCSVWESFLQITDCASGSGHPAAAAPVFQKPAILHSASKRSPTPELVY
jgi:hypothetical protein